MTLGTQPSSCFWLRAARAANAICVTPPSVHCRLRTRSHIDTSSLCLYSEAEQKSLASLDGRPVQSGPVDPLLDPRHSAHAFRQRRVRAPTRAPSSQPVSSPAMRSRFPARALSAVSVRLCVCAFPFARPVLQCATPACVQSHVRVQSSPVSPTASESIAIDRERYAREKTIRPGRPGRRKPRLAQRLKNATGLLVGPNGPTGAWEEPGRRRDARARGRRRRPCSSSRRARVLGMDGLLPLAGHCSRVEAKAVCKAPTRGRAPSPVPIRRAAVPDRDLHSRRRAHSDCAAALDTSGEAAMRRRGGSSSRASVEAAGQKRPAAEKKRSRSAGGHGRSLFATGRPAKGRPTRI